MNKNNLIEQLYKNRILNSDEEYELFEEALEGIGTSVQLKDIPALCQVLDDNTKDDEMMYNIIHLMETLRGVEYLKLIAVTTIKMRKNAFGWAKTLNKRILNSDEYREKYKLVLKEMEGEDIEKVRDLLKKIEEDNPDRFKEKVEDVLQVLIDR